MEKIVVLPVFEGDQKFEWNRGVDIMKKYLHTGYPIKITEEEIEKEGEKQTDSFGGCQHCSSFGTGWDACWNYIKSRINQ